MDLALDFVGKLGIGPENPAIQAAQTGDFSLLEALLASNPNAQGWDKYIQLGKDAYTRLKEAADTKATETTKAVHEAVGGEDQWKVVSEWARSEATEKERAEVNAALSAGGIQAVAMAQYLANLYASADGTTVDPADPVLPNSARTGSVAAEPLSPKEYVAELAKLNRKYGADFETTAEARALAARVQAYRNRN